MLMDYGGERFGSLKCVSVVLITGSDPVEMSVGETETWAEMIWIRESYKGSAAVSPPY